MTTTANFSPFQIVPDNKWLIQFTNEVLEKHSWLFESTESQVAAEQIVEFLDCLWHVFNRLGLDKRYSIWTVLVVNQIMRPTSSSLTLTNLQKQLQRAHFRTGVLSWIEGHRLEKAVAACREARRIAVEAKMVGDREGIVADRFALFLDEEREIFARAGLDDHASTRLLRVLEAERYFIQDRLGSRTRMLTHSSWQRRVRTSRELCRYESRRVQTGVPPMTTIAWMKGQLVGAVTLGVNIGSFVVEPELGVTSAMSALASRASFRSAGTPLYHAGPIGRECVGCHVQDIWCCPCSSGSYRRWLFTLRGLRTVAIQDTNGQQKRWRQIDSRAFVSSRPRNQNYISFGVSYWVRPFCCRVYSAGTCNL
jgi:hypothetical protein